MDIHCFLFLFFSLFLLLPYNITQSSFFSFFSLSVVAALVALLYISPYKSKVDQETKKKTLMSKSYLILYLHLCVELILLIFFFSNYCYSESALWGILSFHFSFNPAYRPMIREEIRIQERTRFPQALFHSLPLSLSLFHTYTTPAAQKKNNAVAR